MTDANIIRQELESLAPNLAKVKRYQRIDIPDEYFDSAEEQIMSQIYIMTQEQVKVNVPSDYFETLDDNIMAGINSEKPKVVPLRSMCKYRYVAAAAIVFVLFFIGYKVSPLVESGSDRLPMMSQIADSEYYQYLHQNIDEVDMNMLIEHNLVDESDLAILSYNDHYGENASFFFDSDMDY